MKEEPVQLYYLNYLSEILVDVFCISILNLTCMKLAGSSSGICVDVKSQLNLLKNIFLFFLFFFPVHEGSNTLASDNQTPVLPPVAVCRNITVQLGLSGTAVIDITDIDNGSHDPDGSIVRQVGISQYIQLLTTRPEHGGADSDG